MKLLARTILLFSCFLIFKSAEAQFYQAVPDSICINEGESFDYNVFANDFIEDPTADIFLVQSQGDECFFIDEAGFVRDNPANIGSCCGTHLLTYFACTVINDVQTCDETTVEVIVKCGKPDCSLFNMLDYLSQDPAGDGSQSDCIDVCENSNVIFYLPYIDGYSYDWTVDPSGNVTAGSNPAEIVVNWPMEGSGNVLVQVTDPSGVVTSISLCVNVMVGPTADFTSAATVCLDSPILFENLSINADEYVWDMGDGTIISNVEDPTYTYAIPGTYQVVLYATGLNFDENGNPLCCCTDSIVKDVIVDPLPGPNIYWISTLCEGDSSKYWTDATNCGSYVWNVEDGSGNDLIYAGQGTDTICVAWNGSDIGLITLEVSGCDSAYCTTPTSVMVPIITATTDVEGPIEVCVNSTHTYSIPKWNSVVYDWTVLDLNGNPVSFDGQDGHQINVNWTVAGISSIQVSYQSEFLGGLVDADPSDCSGTAELMVNVKPYFELFNSNTLVCPETMSFISATSSPSTDYTWTVSPPASFTGQGTSNIVITWDSGPGTYIVTAVSNDGSAYCNASETIVYEVVDMQPPILIEGNDSICPGEPQLYTVVGSQPGVGFFWNITNGTPTFASGNSVTVTWNGSGTISVYQYLLTAPGCSSEAISMDIIEQEIQGPLNVTGTAACTNSISNYTLTPGQLDNAEILWSVAGATDGSIVSGQGTENIQVQWNNDPGVVSVDVEVTLCGDTMTYSLTDTLYSPIQPEITQVGTLCPGVSATLETDPGFVSYDWNTGSTTNSTVISLGGVYSVTTVDNNGCEATDYFTANELPGPNDGISSPDNPSLCINDGQSVEIFAQTSPSYYYEWFCNGDSQGPYSSTSNLIHTNTDTVQNFNYYFNVIDSLTGCIGTSDIFLVTQDSCLGPGCTPEANSVLFTSAITMPPFCDEYTFTPVLTNATVSNWSFGDGNFSGLTSPTHQYSEAACYNVVLTALVPEVGTNGTSFCAVSYDRGLCVPVAADFSFAYLACGDVQFTDFSTFIDPADPIISWNWSFGSTDQFPPVQNFASGTHTITLIVETLSGCQASASYDINIGAVEIDSINTSSVPDPACVGDAITFSTVATSAVSWFWDFDDGATFSGPSPLHSYDAPGTYNVVLTVADADGCTDTDSISVLVNPGIPELFITPGDSIACEGQTITLVAPPGYDYEWSTGETTATIDVTSTDNYSVTVTDGSGCFRELESVYIDFFPLPNATITGNPVICDIGCTNLSAPSGSGYTYIWMDASGIISTAPNISVCSGAINNPYSVQVTDANGCVNISDEIDVEQATSPNFAVDISPDPCEGKPITLTINPIEPDVNYNWSNGATGTSIVVFSAGTYTAVGTNVNNGCSFSASATINPLPDLCLVPTGCYQVCDPDTICGPEGLASYQWLFNGSPTAGMPGMENCIEVTQSGNYNLIATNDFGCTDTSGTLILDVIDCDPDPTDPCDDLTVGFDYLTGSDGVTDTCCVSLSYSNNTFDLAGMMIHSADAELIFDLTSIDPSLDESGYDDTHITLVSSGVGGPIPSDVANFIDLCFGEVYNSPQILIFDWYDFDANVVCSDTLEFNCPVEPDCIYLDSDSIYCDDNQQVIYELTICNPSNADFAVGYIDFEVFNPLGIDLTPDVIDISGSPILPGSCQTFTFLLEGDDIAGETFCYNLVAHAGNPLLDPTVDCCSLDTIYCVDIPVCDPCEYVGIEGVSQVQDEDCCFLIDIYNDFDDDFFDEIALCAISPATTINVTNPFGSGWLTSNLTSTSVSFLPQDGSLDLGVSTLPKICVETELAPDQLFEIKWMRDGEIYCVDTVVTSCEPDCGYLFDEVIDCTTDGGWSYSASLKNMTDHTIDGVDITFEDPALAGYNQTFSISPTAPLGIYSSIVFNLGLPASAGDTICFEVTLHDVSDQGNHLTCCTFRHCIVLPDCGVVNECICEEPEFSNHVLAGITCIQDATNPNLYFFQLTDSTYFNDCDVVTWNFSPGIFGETIGGEGIYHDYGSVDFERVCVYVYRLDSNGEKCEQKTCKLNDAKSEFVLYPNPSDGIVSILSKRELSSDLLIEVRDVNDRPVLMRNYSGLNSASSFRIDISDLSPGLYFVNFVVDGKRTVEILSRQ